MPIKSKKKPNLVVSKKNTKFALPNHTINNLDETRALSTFLMSKKKDFPCQK